MPGSRGDADPEVVRALESWLRRVIGLARRTLHIREPTRSIRGETDGVISPSEPAGKSVGVRQRY